MKKAQDQTRLALSFYLSPLNIVNLFLSSIIIKELLCYCGHATLLQILAYFVSDVDIQYGKDFYLFFVPAVYYIGTLGQ